jgi:hypothetical protein
MTVNKAWQFLLLHPIKGYYTGYKGDEMFGDFERAKIYRTRDEAFMDTLSIPHKLELESVLLWHRTINETKLRPVNFSNENQDAPLSEAASVDSYARKSESALNNPLSNSKSAPRKSTLRLVHSR